jgi:DNA ligase-1
MAASTIRKPMKGESMNDLLAKCRLDDDSTLEIPQLQLTGYVDPKIDGIRLLCDGGRAVTNSLEDVPNRYIREIMSHPLLQGLDGELTIGDTTAPDVYRRTFSAFSRHDDKPTDVRFNVFDCITHDGADLTGLSFSGRKVVVLDRIGFLGECLSNTDITLRLNVVPSKRVMCAKDILEAETEYLAQGYEGLMYRRADGAYKFGRSTLKQLALAKLKRVDELDAEIIGTYEQQYNGNEAYTDNAGRTKRSSAQDGKVGKGTLGGFICRLVTGEEFRVGIGMKGSLTDAKREEYWAIRDTLPGTWIKVGYQACGMKGNIPRTPKFIAFRSKADIG